MGISHNYCFPVHPRLAEIMTPDALEPLLKEFDEKNGNDNGKIDETEYIAVNKMVAKNLHGIDLEC